MQVKVELDREAAMDFLRANAIGRVGFVQHDRAVILPVTYGVADDGSILFRSTRGSKLSVAHNEIGPVAFEVDQTDLDSGTGRAVLVRGHMGEVLSTVEQTRLRRTIDVSPWADAVPRDNWIRIVPTSVEAWTYVL